MKIYNFLHNVKSLQRDKEGNVAIIFAMTIIPIIALIGGAVDFKRAFGAKEDLRACMETAALMLPARGIGANSTVSEINSEIHTVLSAQPRCAPYLNEDSFGIHASFSGHIIQDAGPRRGRLNVSAQASIDTFFLGTLQNMNILNGEKWGGDFKRIKLNSADNPLEIDIASNTKLEVALVLDTTGSMGNWLGGKKKIESLKESVKELVKTLRSSDPECAPDAGQPNSNSTVPCKHIRMGMVPFASKINIGTPKNSKGLFKATSDYTTPTDTVPGWLNTVDFPTNTANGNIIVDPQYQWIQPYVDGWLTRYSIPVIKNHLNYHGITFTETPGSSQVNLNSWKGCVLPRSGQLYTDNSLAFDGDDASKIKADDSHSCPTKPVQRLTSTIYDIKKSVDKLSPNGSTNTAIGLEWGWRVLSKGVDQGIDFDETGNGNTEVKSYDDAEWQKVIILMTDGTNSHYSYNGLTETLCDNVKAAGIKIFSIAFLPESQKSGTAHDLMQGCASRGSYFFHATSATGLASSFSTIAKELSALRVSR